MFNVHNDLEIQDLRNEYLPNLKDNDLQKFHSYFLVGNVDEMPDKNVRAVSFEEMVQVSREYHCTYMEVSTKTGFNCERLFRNIVEQIIGKKLEAREYMMEKSRDWVIRELKRTPSGCCTLLYFFTFYTFLSMAFFICYTYIIFQMIFGIELKDGDDPKQPIVAVSMLLIEVILIISLMCFKCKHRP